jgi:hypothetical protein
MTSGPRSSTGGSSPATQAFAPDGGPWQAPVTTPSEGPAPSPLAPSTTALSAGEQAFMLQTAEGAARAAVGAPVRFGRPRSHAVEGRWAFVVAPLQPPTAAGDYAVLLSRSEAGWSVVAAAFGAQDGRDWAGLYGAPSSLFAPRG